jgi:hypothetical protein
MVTKSHTIPIELTNLLSLSLLILSLLKITTTLIQLLSKG